jgi:hypothetical protein
MNTTRARENQADVRELLRERYPALAALLNAAAGLPCGPGCRVSHGEQGPFWEARRYDEPVPAWAGRVARERAEGTA